MTTIQARESLPIGSGDPALPVSDDDRLQRAGSAQGTGTSSLVLGSAQGTGTSSLDRGSHSLPPLPMETDIERSHPSMIGDNAGAPLHTTHARAHTQNRKWAVSEQLLHHYGMCSPNRLGACLDGTETRHALERLYLHDSMTLHVGYRVDAGDTVHCVVQCGLSLHDQQ